MELQTLRSQRKAAFWGKITPYFPYVLQSGVAVLFLILMIAFSAWYTSFVLNLPADLPIRWIMLVLLTPLTVYASIRTYLQPADVVFLLPQESKMKAYFTSAYVSGIVYKMIGLLIILLTSWPLYIRAETNPKPWWLLLLVLIVLKLLSSYGGWQELRIVSVRARQGYRLFRWSVITLMLAAWLWQPILSSAIFMALLSINYILSLRLSIKHTVAWETLISTEKTQAARVMVILGWFVDVPAEGQKVYPRRWLSWIGRNIPWGNGSAYRYLLNKSWIRSELLGIIVRISLLGMLLVWWVGASWLGAGLYLVFVFAIGTQLTALRHYHRDSPVVSYYPLPEGSLFQAVSQLAFRIQMLVGILIWIPMLFALVTDLTFAIGTLVAGIALILIMRMMSARKWTEEEEL